MNVLTRENHREDCPVPCRCPWGDSEDMQMRQYHDLEWGTPLHDSRALFELLSLELMQSGLSWRTILHQRQGFIRAFHNFDPHVVLPFDPKRVTREINKLGVNVNQIAARVNAQDYATLAEVEETRRLLSQVQEQLHECWQLMKRDEC